VYLRPGFLGLEGEEDGRIGTFFPGADAVIQHFEHAARR
jgi:hypothetical protein